MELIFVHSGISSPVSELTVQIRTCPTTLVSKKKFTCRKLSVTMARFTNMPKHAEITRDFFWFVRSSKP